MHYPLRPLNLPDDYAAIARLLNANLAEPITAEKLAEDDQKIPRQNIPKLDEQGRLAGFYRERAVAVDPNDQVVGYVVGWRAPFTEPGYINSTLVVDPARWGQGVGSALARHLIDWATGLGGTLLQSELRDHLPAAREFAERRGFYVDKHLFQSTLDLASFDWAPYGDVIARVEASGIHFTTLDQHPGESTERALYELVKETYTGVPWMEDKGFLPFGEWRRWTLEPCRREDIILAYVGDRLVGTAMLIYNQQTRGLYNEYTGVDQAYRGRRIALALKLLAIRKGEQLQALYVRTDNDSQNEPMLAINRKMGYVAAPGTFRIRKLLA